MVTPLRTWVAAASGLVTVVLGALVLRSPGAQAGFGWFAYSGPPSPDLLDSLVAWNPLRAVGALLVLAGLLVLSRLLGVLVGRRGGPARSPVVRRVLVLAAVLVLGGLVAIVVLGTVGRSAGVGAMSKAAGGSQLVLAPTVWTRGQVTAALVVAAGLVVAALATGVGSGRAGRGVADRA